MRLLACLLLAAVAQAPSTNFALKAAVSAPEQEIRAMEAQWNEARAHGDVATLDRVLVGDWTVTHANGTTDTKAEYLADLRSGARKFAGAVTESDLVIRLYGDTAVAAGSSNSTVTLNGHPQEGALHFTPRTVNRAGAGTMCAPPPTPPRLHPPPPLPPP